MVRPRLSFLNGLLLVEGLIEKLISISQLCDQGFKVSFNKGKCVLTTKEHEEVINGSRSKDNYYLWRSELTSGKTFKDEKKYGKKSDKTTKGGMYDTMVEHPAQNLTFAQERKYVETFYLFLGCQVSQMQSVI